MGDRDAPQNVPPRSDPPAIAGAFAQMLSASRWLVLLAVLILLFVGLGAFAYAIAVVVHGVSEIVRRPFPLAPNVAHFLAVIDLTLIGATMLIAAIGFYELFIDRVGASTRRMPTWLEMRDLNDLKIRVISMVVLVAAVSFVEVLVDFRHGIEVVEVGGGVAVVIGALTAFIRLGGHQS